MRIDAIPTQIALPTESLKPKAADSGEDFGQMLMDVLKEVNHGESTGGHRRLDDHYGKGQRINATYHAGKE